jgi:hypothetical protein
MATTTNYGWTTPDDTDLVKDGAAAIRTLGSSIDTSFAADEGDLLVGGTSDIFEALPIGAAGTVLTSDGDTAEWVAPGAVGGNFTLLNAGGTALTGATTVTVSGITGQSQLFVQIMNASSANASSTISLRLNTDTGTNYDMANIRFLGETTYGSNYQAGESLPTESLIEIGRMANSASGYVTGGVILFGCNASGVKPFLSLGAGNTTSTQRAMFNAGIYDSSSTISSISIVSSSGNLDDGTVFVYGSAV